MQVKFIARDLKDIRITPDIEAAVEKKLAQRLRKHLREEQVITVRAADNKPGIKVELELVYRKQRLSAEAEVKASDGINIVLLGVEKCLDAVDKQVEKYRTKSQVRPARKIGEADEVGEIDGDYEDEDEDENEQDYE